MAHPTALDDPLAAADLILISRSHTARTRSRSQGIPIAASNCHDPLSGTSKSEIQGVLHCFVGHGIASYRAGVEIWMPAHDFRSTERKRVFLCETEGVALGNGKLLTFGYHFELFNTVVE